jgi:zinc/manganese transport system permease protein/iron/zinc/copper transport system permease protein
MALGVSAVTFIATDVLVARRTASKNTTFAFVFALLLAVGYLVASLFPALESHMAQVYFGDLATLTTFDSQISIGVSAVCLTVLLVWLKPISNQSFEWAIFGELVTRKVSSLDQIGFKLVTLVMLCLSVQFVGFLFTIAMLFLPTALMTYLESKGLARHNVLTALLAATSTLIGFSLSLFFTRLPTVPAIVVVLFGLSLGVLGVERVYLWLRVVRREVSTAQKTNRLSSEPLTP